MHAIPNLNNLNLACTIFLRWLESGTAASEHLQDPRAHRARLNFQLLELAERFAQHSGSVTSQVSVPPTDCTAWRKSI